MDPNIEAQLRKRNKDKRKSKRAGGEEGGGLNMNSMMDMMTIILVFLLKSYGSEPIQVGADTDLPYSVSEDKPKATMTISISQKSIFVDTTKALDLTNEQRVSLNDLQGGSKTGAIVPMGQLLDEAVRVRRDKYKEEDEEGILVTLIADVKTPYLTLAQIFQTAIASEIKRFRFVVYKGDMKLSGTVQVRSN